jgi:hypothetical protein
MQSVELFDEDFGKEHCVLAIHAESQLFSEIQGSLGRLSGFSEEIKQQGAH